MMYNFIICDDSKYFNDSYQKVIVDVANILNIKFCIHSFSIYNDELEELIYDNSIENKIYILDLLLPIVPGDKIGRIIRETDMASFIIFITSFHSEFEDIIVNGEYFYLKFIDKNGNFQEVLFDTLKRNIEKKKSIETLKIEIKNQFYQIVPNNITYICTEDRKIVIHNIYDDNIIISTTLSHIHELLPNHFMLSKNCCLINIKRISNIDKNDRIIYFNNNDKTNLVSKSYLNKIMKELNKVKD